MDKFTRSHDLFASVFLDPELSLAVDRYELQKLSDRHSSNIFRASTTLSDTVNTMVRLARFLFSWSLNSSERR